MVEIRRFSMAINRKPDFEQFLKVLQRRGKPDHLPFYEHIASPGFMAERMGPDYKNVVAGSKEYWRMFTDFWIGMGFDCVPMEIGLNCSLAAGHGALSEGSEAHSVIHSWDDFERYPWPEVSAPIEFRHFEVAATMLPEGAKIVGGVGMGPYEWVSQMMGTIGLSYALADDPELVGAVFTKIGDLIESADRQLASMDAICALRQGDDLGFKTATFLSPEDLRKYVFPVYKRMATVAHEAGKPFILHSCGNLAAVYDDLIDYCKIDAKHSFEDVILPVSEFKKQYGTRITALGGLDVDVICRSTEDEVRAYARKQIEACFADGYWALGTGNSLTDYMPVSNYLAVLDEGLKIAG
jgi:uroporphyrinogen decarboxylase